MELQVDEPNTLGAMRQSFASAVATVGVFGLGTVLAYTSPALPQLKSDNAFGNTTNSSNLLTVEATSWIGAIAMLGALVASPLAGLSIDFMGRKKSMILFGVPFILGWILIGLASSLWLLLTGRFITGFCGGGFSLVGPVYISEISGSKIRGTLLSLFQLMLVTGILFTYGFGSILSWRQLAYLSSAIPCLLMLLIPTIPESPRYYVQKEKPIQAEESLRWLTGFKLNEKQDHIQAELAMLKQSVVENQREQTRLIDIFQWHLLKPLAVCLSLMIFEQISGFNALIFYAGEIFREAGSSLDGNVSSIIVGVVQVIATIASSIMVDRLGRRPLLLWPQILMGLSLVAMGTFFYLNQPPVPPMLAHLKWIPLVGMLVFIVAFSIGIGPLSWTMMAEILPPNIKGACSSLATALVWLSAFFVTKSFDTVAAALGIYWCFWIFAICCFLGFISIYFTVPETKGKTLEEIQINFR